MANHAYLSASASHRWLACPPSAKLCAQAGDQTSEYAIQGSCAHELAQYQVEKALGRECQDPTENLTYYDAEMLEAAEAYRDFVLEQVETAKALCKDPFICVEQTLDYSKWVEHGYGTGDCVIVADGVLHVIDLKYGVGILVKANQNSQLMCYGLGALDTFGNLYDFDRIRLTIFQPRRENVPTLGEDEIAAILPQIDNLVAWAEDLKAWALQQALSGVRYPGFKLVEGRSIRKYTDETAVAEAVIRAGFDPFEKKLLGITAMQRQLGKKKFDELLGGLVIKPQGKPVLVPASDKRAEMNSAVNDFMEE